MATIEELLKQYETDEALKVEVDEILAEFVDFINKHDVEVSLKDFHKIIKEAKAAGLIK